MRKTGQNFPRESQELKATGSSNKVGNYELETPLIAENGKKSECFCCSSPNAYMADYRCWDTESLGDLLTPEVSPVLDSDEESQSIELRPNRNSVMGKKRSVTFLDSHHTNVSTSCPRALSIPNPVASHMAIPTKRSLFGRKRSKKHPTINYSIIIANNLLQNIVVNTCEGN